MKILYYQCFVKLPNYNVNVVIKQYNYVLQYYLHGHLVLYPKLTVDVVYGTNQHLMGVVSFEPIAGQDAHFPCLGLWVNPVGSHAQLALLVCRPTVSCCGHPLDFF